jgi:hypothetical protein
VNTLHPFFEIIGGVVGLGYSAAENFGRFPASLYRATCFDTKDPQAANDMRASCDQLIDKISHVELFSTGFVTPTTTLTNMIVDIYG